VPPTDSLLWAVLSETEHSILEALLVGPLLPCRPPQTGFTALLRALAKALNDRFRFVLDLKYALHFAGNRVDVLG
jgi:hypothetical protein